MYKTILVPVDINHAEHGKETLTIARQIGGDDCRVVALFVAQEIPGYVAIEVPKDALRDSLKRANDEIAAIAEPTGAEPVVLGGHAPTKILEYSKEIGADLIVIASHTPSVRDYFLGSTAARVVRYAECAVLVDR